MVKKGNLEAAKAAAKKAVRKAAAKTKAAAKPAAAKPAAAKPSPSKPSKVKTEPTSPKATPTTLVTKGDVSNFLGQMKRSKDPNVKKAFEHYQSLSKFDSKKNDMVAQWKQDKGTWWKQVLESEEQSTLTQQSGCVGWSTRLGCPKLNSLFSAIQIHLCQVGSCR